MKKVLIAMIVLMSVAALTGCAPNNRNIAPTPLVPTPAPVVTPGMTPSPGFGIEPGVDQGIEQVPPQGGAQNGGASGNGL